MPIALSAGNTHKLGFSRSALLERGPGWGWMYERQGFGRLGDLGRFGRQLCKETGDSGQGQTSP